MPESVLVLGAGGFVGAHVVRELTARAIPVTAAVRRRADAWRVNRIAGLGFAEADITDVAAVRALIGEIRPTTIINAAGYGVSGSQRDPTTMFAVNVTAPSAIVTAAREHNVRRFVHLGTCSEYGAHAGPVRETSALQPVDAYGASKAAAGLLIADPGFTAPVDAIVLRLFNIWGPLESPQRLIPSVIASCRAKTPLDLTAGTQIKDYSFVPDMARWIVDIALRPAPYAERIVNLASGTLIAVKDLVLAVARELDGVALMKFGARPMPARETQTGAPDLARLNALLPQRTVTGLTEAVKITLGAAS